MKVEPEMRSAKKEKRMEPVQGESGCGEGAECGWGGGEEDPNDPPKAGASVNAD